MATEEERTVQGLMEMQRRIAHSNNRFERCFGSMLVAGTLERHLATLTDRQIGQLMSDHVGHDLSILQPELMICHHAICRLFRSTGGTFTAEELAAQQAIEGSECYQCDLRALKIGMTSKEIK
jgi:hypothetical protein